MGGQLVGLMALTMEYLLDKRLVVSMVVMKAVLKALKMVRMQGDWKEQQLVDQSAVMKAIWLVYLSGLPRVDWSADYLDSQSAGRLVAQTVG
jgi:hypothetical protein